ncbi:MAG TPA: type II 3-dehydroquinate dehydratase [Nannocystis sp.]
MSGTPRVLVIHGPNLNLLGLREPGIYGQQTLAELDESLYALGRELGAALTIRQSNHEGVILDWIHAAAHDQDGIIINPGGYTHTSVAIQDALRAVPVPAIEVHITNLFRRESLRQTSVTGVACVGVIMGLGAASYHLALRHLVAEHRARPS